MKLSTLLTCAAALWLAGCASAPKPLYLWENFPRQQYQVLQGNGSSPQDQIRDLQAHVERARGGDQALPPGLRAHLGMLLLAAGDPDQARQLWQAEKIAFPEATLYIDQLLKRMNPATPKPSAAP
jgi:hypothetical protein